MMRPLSESDLVRQLCSNARDAGLDIGGFDLSRLDPPRLTRHPLGFYVAKIALVGVDVLRLHIWRAGDWFPSDPAWPVHDHMFDLESVVVLGRVLNSVYEVTDSEHGDGQLYSVEYSDRGSVRIRTERRVTCRKVSEDSIAAVQKYRVGAGTFHSTAPSPNCSAVTIARTTRISDRPPLVVGDPSGLPLYEYLNQTLSDQQRKGVFESIARMLQ